MIPRNRWLLLFTACAAFASSVIAAPPPLLAKAIEQWNAGRADLSFTQHQRDLNDDGTTKYERVERYDPSQPTDKRWELLSVNGNPPTPDEIKKIQDKRNNKPRKKGGKSPSDYLDLNTAVLAEDSKESARFEVGLNPETLRLVAVDKLTVIITVDKSTETISHISSVLREPMRVALGLAKITDVDLDVQVASTEDSEAKPTGETAVKPGSTARVVMSKFGDPVEYKWSDFKRVITHPSALKEDEKVAAKSAK